jgi:DNA polymerase III delta prime subunit
MKYRLDVLHNKDFEDLAKDLLEKDLGNIRLQSFRSGKDKGIDMRYAADFENEIIVQAKHYIHSTFSNLKRELENERKKMGELTPVPKRYILVTSFDLNVGQTDKIVELFSPFIRNSQDVYGRTMIESLIEDNPKIEEKYYKLWLTSTNVLKNILHNGVKGRSEFIESRILKRSKLYVPTQNFNRAIEKLHENNVLIITGEPGVGKTTIAYQLLYGLLGQGFELVNIDNKISDAEEVLFLDPEQKQVAFFDDFLGPNIAEILNPRNSQSTIVNFVERIRESKNKLLILATRTTILNQANRHYEKFKKLGKEEELKYSVVIREYSKLDKARILYNHIYHTLDEDYHDVFLEDNFYKSIVEHENFFPRLIEFITTNSRFKGKNINEAKDFIQRSLDYPDEIWEYAYRDQLSPEDQFLLCTLFSFGKDVSLEVLNEAFNARYDYEISNNGFQRKMDAFNLSLTSLSDGFISSYLDKQSGSISIGLLNPSISDFLLHYLAKRPDEIKRLFYSAVFVDQVTFYFGPKGDYLKLPSNEIDAYYNRFKEIIPRLVFLPGVFNSKPTYILYIFFKLFRKQVNEQEVLSLVEEIDLTKYGAASTRYLFVLNEALGFSKVKEHIVVNWQGFFCLALSVAEDATHMCRYFELFSRYGIDEDIWSKDEGFMNELMSVITDAFETTIDDLDYSLVQERARYYEEDAGVDYDESDVVDVVDKEFDSFLREYDLDQYKDQFWDGIDFDPQRILERQVEQWHDYSDYHDYDYGRGSLPTGEASGDPDAEIDRLFER